MNFSVPADPRRRPEHRPADWSSVDNEQDRVLRESFEHWRTMRNYAGCDRGIQTTLNLLHELPGVNTLWCCEGHGMANLPAGKDFLRDIDGQILPAAKFKRGKLWTGFYIVLVVNAEGEERVLELMREIDKGAFGELYPNYFLWEYSTIPNPMTWRNDEFHQEVPDFLPDITVRIREEFLHQQFWPLAMKPHAIAHFENAIRRVIKSHDGGIKAKETFLADEEASEDLTQAQRTAFEALATPILTKTFQRYPESDFFSPTP